MKLIALAFLALAACGSDEDPVSKGEYCDSTGQAYCDRVIACGFTDSFNACFQNFKQACCLADRSCDFMSTRSVAQQNESVRNCSSALSKQSCQEVQTQTVLPAACLMN